MASTTIHDDAPGWPWQVGLCAAPGCTDEPTGPTHVFCPRHEAVLAAAPDAALTLRTRAMVVA